MDLMRPWRGRRWDGDAWRGERDCNLRLQLPSSLPSSTKPSGYSSWIQHHIHRTQALGIVPQLMERFTVKNRVCFFLSNSRDRAAVTGKIHRQEQSQVSYFWCVRLIVTLLVPWTTPRRSHGDARLGDAIRDADYFAAQFKNNRY